MRNNTPAQIRAWVSARSRLMPVFINKVEGETRSCAMLHEVRSGKLAKIHRYEFRYALFCHCDAINNVGACHSAFIVRYDDKL